MGEPSPQIRDAELSLNPTLPSTKMYLSTRPVSNQIENISLSNLLLSLYSLFQRMELQFT